MKVYLIGVGMGNPDLLTIEADQAIRSSDLLIGAERLLEPFDELGIELLAMTSPSKIASAILEGDYERVSVLLSGDIGFFSGAKSLYPLLEECEVVSIAGISSLSYFCARCHTTWHDVHTISCHGRDGGVVPAVQSHARTFVLTGGKFLVENLCEVLTDAGLGELECSAGERLSYPDERIVHGQVQELAEMSFTDLSVLLVENPNPIQPIFQAPGLSDDSFIRGKVPMTKEEIRVLAVSRLHLCSHDVVWDVGAGTGSVSVECALCLPEGSVWAIERNAQACDLIEANREKYQLSNLYVVESEAPDGLDSLPAPDAVFIGGSSGRLSDIVAEVLRQNTAARIVVSAITLEGLTGALEAMKEFAFQDTDIIQVAVSRSHEVASYHMMKAENPIYLISMENPK